MKKYEKLKAVHPATISLEQLRLICKISKRSARYLVANGIIPSIDTGKNTWRYKISMDDVIDYLRRRERHGSMIPIGIANDCKTGRHKKSFSQVVAKGQEKDVAEYFSAVFADAPDVLTICEIAEITGLDKKTFFRIINARQLNALAKRPRYVVSKVHFREFLESRRFIDLWSNSEDFAKVIEGYKAWKNGCVKTEVYGDGQKDGATIKASE